MSKSKSSSSFLGELFSVGLYKRNQGRHVRQISAIAIAAVFLVAAWTMQIQLLSGASELMKNLIPGAVSVLGVWLAYRIVNYPPAADFMIAVQAEMEKVSWPTWSQLWRATIVVLFVMIFLAVSLFAFDVLWQAVFSYVGFLKLG
ncbi:MAG: preprotein translocase subunit SecE [Planctomycetaceae bacterium]|nr:preprotein translocase subunit SecE [Planctomycetaceae bacterium]